MVRSVKEDISGFETFGALLSVPVFVKTLSRIMVLATTFVIDTWNGSKVMKTLTDWDSTFIDWASLFVFLGSPLIIGPITLFTQTEEWWTITSISWFCVVFAYFVVFFLAAIYYDSQGCLAMVRHHRSIHCDSNEHGNNNATFLTLFWYALELRMTRMLSGIERFTHIVHHSDQHSDPNLNPNPKSEESYQSTSGLFSKLTRQRFMRSFYHVLDEPVRQYSVSYILGSIPYVTRSSWGLEYIFCLGRNANFITIIDGLSSLTPRQVQSSNICFAFGMFFIIFTLLGVMVWFELPYYAIIIAVILYMIVQYSAVKRVIFLNKTYRKSNALTLDDGTNSDVNQLENSNALYEVKETFRITKPKSMFWRSILGIEVIFFFLIPLIALFTAGNNRVGIVFIIAGIITVPHVVFNSAETLSELGSLEGLNKADDMSEWRQKHRLSQIVSSISRRSGFWLRVFLIFVVAICIVFYVAIQIEYNDGEVIEMKFAPREEFEYERSKFLGYSSCAMNLGIESPDKLFRNNLADFAFLSAIAALDDDSATKALNDWFVDVKTENLNTNVTEFKDAYKKEHTLSAVTYKLVSFPDQGDQGDQDLHIISVRGTKNGFDALADFQLWGSIIFSEFIIDIMPLGFLWKPVLPHFVKALSVIENNALEDVSYYRETTAFVESLKENGLNVEIVGHCEYSCVSVFD